MVVFCALSAVLFQLFALARLRKSFYFYIFILPFLPAYIAIPFSDGGAGISLSRMFTYSVFLSICVTVVSSPKFWAETFGRMLRWRFFLPLLAVVFTAKLVSSILSEQPVALLYWLDEVVAAFIVILLAAKYLNSVVALEKMFKLLLVAFLIQQVLAVADFSMGRPLLLGLIDVRVSTVGTDILQGFERDGVYRSIGMFDNPLSLAEYSILGFVFMIGFSAVSKSGRSMILPLSVATLVLSYIVTQARFVPISIGFSLLMSLIVFHGFRFNIATRPFFYGLLALVVSILSTLVYFAINDVHRLLEITSIFNFNGESGTASIISRASQYQLIPAEILGNSTGGLLGEGMKSDIVERLDVRLDNYFLRTLIEGGLIAMVGFGLLLALVIRQAASRETYKYISDPRIKQIRFFFVLFFITFTCNKFFLSMPFNNYFFYLFSGALISLASPNPQPNVMKGI
ncbi:hypothetical protein [Rhodobacter ferrooxidans]|uniref:Uncharacterized protein n=1 Tax=Rhodobacter ferrooxidans TaxID=371731 RepID=C8S377_9RHOB|nr:hypothetical protein [Rhodobacter sp. SW2]EEW24559.1 hypothetical protein Rsw2DRAFT_2505 [Rhodobacter sp. SW2]